MLLGSGQDEDGIWRRLLKRLQEGIEGCRAKHVHLIDDGYLIATLLRCKAYTVYEFPDIIHRVIGGGIQFKDVERGILIEGAAGRTFAASLNIGCQILAINGSGENTRTGGLSYAPGTAKQEGMCKVLSANGILEGGRNMLLPD